MADKFSVAALARKWCPVVTPDNVPHLLEACICDELTAAIREALKEAEKVAKEWAAHYPASARSDKIAAFMVRHSSKEIAARIAALRGKA